VSTGAGEQEGLPMSDGPERRIVVGVEGSGYARAALIWALEEAHHRGAVIEVVTCYSPT